MPSGGLDDLEAATAMPGPGAPRSTSGSTGEIAASPRALAVEARPARDAALATPGPGTRRLRTVDSSAPCGRMARYSVPGITSAAGRDRGQRRRARRLGPAPRSRGPLDGRAIRAQDASTRPARVPAGRSGRDSSEIAFSARSRRRGVPARGRRGRDHALAREIAASLPRRGARPEPWSRRSAGRSRTPVHAAACAASSRP